MLALVLECLHPGQTYLLALPTATSANLLLPLQQDFKFLLQFLHLNKICILFFQSLHCAADRHCLRKTRCTFFHSFCCLVGEAYFSCLPLPSLCFSWCQSISVSWHCLFYCVFPALGTVKNAEQKGLVSGS